MMTANTNPLGLTLAQIDEKLEVARINGDVMVTISVEELEKLLALSRYTVRKRRRSRALKRQRKLAQANARAAEPTP